MYIITGKRKRAISPLERHNTVSPIFCVLVSQYHILCHLRSRHMLGGFSPIYGQFPGSWLVETQNPWLWLVRSCEGRHDEQRQFWSKSLFLEAHSLTGNSLGSYGFYSRNSAIWPLYKHPGWDNITTSLSFTQISHIFLDDCNILWCRLFQYVFLSNYVNIVYIFGTIPFFFPKYWIIFFLYICIEFLTYNITEESWV